MSEPEKNYYPIDISVPQNTTEPAVNTPPTVLSESNIIPAPNGTIMNGGTMQSPNFSHNNSGWKIDSNGNVEFGSGYFRGDITGASGSFSGTVSIGTGDNIFVGGTNGIQLGDATFADAPFSVTMAGVLKATSGTIGGFTITSTSLYGGIIKTAATVSVGNNGVIMDSAGLRGYDSILGKVFDIHTDGSAPEFAFGNISNSIFEINTNAILRTSATVGDGSASSAGILINDTGLYATEANQTLANANVKILIDGSAVIKMNVKGGQTDFNTGIGYFLGLSGGDYKFSIGSAASNYLTWDGVYLKIKGSFDVGTGGLINNSSYTVANLPVAPTAVGFEVPSAYTNVVPIAYDAFSNGTATTSNTVTWSHTCTGTNLCLIVAVGNGNGNTSGVTYNGVAMTAISNGGSGDSLWYLVNPDTGAHDIVATKPSGTSNINGAAASYTGVSQTAPIDSSNTGSSATSPLTASTTVVSTNSWLVGMGFCSNSSSGGTMSTGASTDRQILAWTDVGANVSMVLADSNGVVAVGSQDMVLVRANPVSAIKGIVCSLAPYVTNFVDPANIYASDNAYATLAATSGDLVVEVSKNAGVTWQTPKTVTFTSSDTTQTAGLGSTELFGSSFTRADMVNANFYIRLSQGSIKQIYKTYGFSTGSDILTGIEITIEGKYASSTISLDYLGVKIYYGTSILPVQAGSQAFASNGRKAGEGVGSGTGVLTFYDGSHWIACDTGATIAA